MWTQKSREGYVMVDHRASPGFTEAEALANGYDPRVVKEGQLFECASLTCSHCACSVVKNPLRTRERPFCSACHHYICDVCAFRAAQPDYVHTPYRKIADNLAGRKPEAQMGSPPGLLLP